MCILKISKTSKLYKRRKETDGNNSQISNNAITVFIVREKTLNFYERRTSYSRQGLARARWTFIGRNKIDNI